MRRQEHHNDNDDNEGEEEVQQQQEQRQKLLYGTTTLSQQSQKSNSRTTRTTARRVVVLSLVAILVVISCVTQRKERRRQYDQRRHHKFASPNKLKDFVSSSLSSSSISSSTSSSLRLGDLPGYTGWARPSWTTAHWYKGFYDTSAPPQVDIPYHIQIACRVDDDHHVDEKTDDKYQSLEKPATMCPSLNAIFYVRAYGPNILTGTVKNVNQEKDGHKLYHIYQVTLLFFGARQLCL
ncbi:hypothetical protein ACA910_003476 [Epithemia clementina (nom. ined.)]